MTFLKYYFKKIFGPLIDAFLDIEFKLAIKTGVAACLSFLLGTFLNSLFHQAAIPISELWCTVSSILVLQAHTGGTYKAACERVLGIVIGSFLGSYFSATLGSNSLLLGLCVTSTIILCTLANLKESVRIACLSVAVIMIIFTTQPHISPWAFGLHRFIDSLLGIMVGIAVSLLLWPSRATRKIRRNFANMMVALGELLTKAFGSEKVSLEAFIELEKKIEGLLEDSGAHFNEAELELVFKESKLNHWVLFKQSIQNVLKLINMLKYASSIREQLDSDLNEQVNHFTILCVAVLEHLSIEIVKRKDEKAFEVEMDLMGAQDQVEEKYLAFIQGNQNEDLKMNREEFEKVSVFFYCLRLLFIELLNLEHLTQKIRESRVR